MIYMQHTTRIQILISSFDEMNVYGSIELGFSLTNASSFKIIKNE